MVPCSQRGASYYNCQAGTGTGVGGRVGAGDLLAGHLVVRRAISSGRACRGTVGECMEYMDVDGVGECDVAGMATVGGDKRRVLQGGSGYIGLRRAGQCGGMADRLCSEATEHTNSSSWRDTERRNRATEDFGTYVSGDRGAINEG
ncbi:uncharacterized protein LOC111256952 [Setaria italica]|uniref:uncharacterized protein LOC111256952 n=1 Tax=Setaria italica TaxID=4555 RepID=UPI000BE5C874|nr:uncharacterized protein LOC111256952 [Setaria italica]